MARIRIDIDDLSVAMSDHDNEWVLDLETGKVLMAEWIRDAGMHGDMDLVLDADPDEEDEDDERDPPDPLESDRFRFIDSIDSHEGFRWMERFADSQDDERVRAALLDSLDRPRPFRRFKDALMEFPQARDAWFVYEEKRLREEAEAWLSMQEIDAELFDLRQSPSASPEAEA